MSHLRRRDFLHGMLCATAASGAFTSMLPKLALAGVPGQARLKGAGIDYRALVCVFLDGGNDSFSTVVPIDGSHRDDYDASRRGTGTGSGGGQSNPSDLRIASQSLLPLLQNGMPVQQDGSRYGLHPRLPGLHSLFHAGRAAIVANVGPLVRPLNQADYRGGGLPVPAQLFSHADQAVLWQTPRADARQRIGWGGRLADLFQSSNSNPLLSMSMSIDGENVFQAGQAVLPYFLDQQGAEILRQIDTSNNRSWNQARRNTFDALMAASYAHPFERAYAERVRSARSAGELLAEVLRAGRMLDGDGREIGYLDDAYAPFWTVSGLPWQRLDEGRARLPSLPAQLLMVAQVIRQRDALQMSRQLFYTRLRGFDTHDSQNADLPDLLGDLSQAVLAFDQVMNSPAFALGPQVTLFTASEFGRTLTNNGDGTDHGWGGHHFVTGGSVDGGRLFGELPPLMLDNNPLTAGTNQIIPRLAVDQYAATLARWFGLDDADRDALFPNLVHMTGPKLALQGPDLGFMLPM
jgi:uncharacterized protein (DUF1501 family)